MATDPDQARNRRARATVSRLRNPKQARTTAELQNALSNYTDEFLECRDRHDWKTTGMFRVPGGIRRRQTCQRCTSMATDEWTSRGARVGRKYDYVDGYQIHGAGPVDRTYIRLEMINRFNIFDNEADMINAATAPKRRKAS